MQVLLPLDGSEASARTVDFLCACAHGRQEAVVPVLLNVQRLRVRVWPEPELQGQGMTRAAHDQGQALLASARQMLSNAGFTVRQQVSVGAPAATILATARDEGVSAVMMGTRGTGMIGGFALGSVALRVAPASPCPVVLVTPQARLPDPARPLTRVVLPVDGSAVSDTAVERLVALRDLFGPLHVHLAHFEPALTLFESIMPPHDDVLRQWSGEQSRQAVAAADALLTEAGIAHDASYLAGDPAPGIAEFAARKGADLIAMATHGTNALHHASFGSVALKTAILAGTAVMLTH